MGRVQKLREAKPNLIGSAPTLERIQALISKYFMGSKITLKPDGEKKWSIHNAKGPLDAFVVIQKGKRFRFERKAKEE